ncbi:endonuclease/exonuclease/phosphatase family protein [Defluviimonas salinarum]|uniref:Endonuclease/exonuclease/phosphatase family protein n=1 Tax=Defluviimonas salinarum TaxID=2992147 RepID=A0ABT3JAG1_9RHOB|nr:endonuclease/exonuclease/phosphatase family protein [Defluviimonas salinarum]MCW3784435.1 endonuclease/exonuclease/phosphatase family protein [Defluviimonas salinarum]
MPAIAPRLAAALLALSLATGAAIAETRVASWNIEHLGWENGKDYAALAEVGAGFHLIAVQEVMSQDGLDAFERALEARTGADWQVLVSDAVGRGSYREMHAFLWRPEEVRWVDGAALYLDDRDAFAREPFSARFETAEGFLFTLASVHLIYGDSEAEREREAAALAAYRDWLDESFPGTPAFIAGDFNLPPSNPAWAGLGAKASPLIRGGATTLSPVDGRFASLYDNIWAPSGISLPVSDWGILEYPEEILGIDHETARDRVSDHAPVWMTIDARSGHSTFPPLHEARIVADAGDTTRDAAPPALPATFRGNRASGIYHRPDCPGFARISAHNAVTFSSAAEAAAAGFRIAKNCP